MVTVGSREFRRRGSFAPLLVDQNVWKSFQPTNISCGLKIIFMNEKVSKRFDSKFLEKVEFQVSGGGMR